MKEREKIIVTALVILFLVAWLGFPFHTSTRFAGSLWGGLFGVTGSVLMLVPLLYMAVKRIKPLKQQATKYVSMRTLLAWHIYAGVVGPILVVIHSGHKYESPLGVALTAMTIVVVLSGFLGRYLMQQFSTEIREKKALLQRLNVQYESAQRQLAVNPQKAATLRPYTGFVSRLAGTIFLRNEATAEEGVTASPISLLRLAEAVSDVEYAISSHEQFKRWFSSWLKLHIVLSIILYVFLTLHVWAAIHFGLRWWD